MRLTSQALPRMLAQTTTTTTTTTTTIIIMSMTWNVMHDFQ